MRNETVNTLQSKFQMLSSSMDERMCRLWAGTEAIQLGRGGITLVSEATGIAHTTIRRRIRELEKQPEKFTETKPVRIR
jgi:hypothetical protein